ncbi:MAG: hypothetical protein WDW38_009523 [Sanguina aurantia]
MALSLGVAQRDMTLVKGRVVYNSPSASQARRLAEAAPGVPVISIGQHRLGGDREREPVDLFQIVDRASRCRLVYLSPIKTMLQLSPSVLDAPVGLVTVAFMNVVGAQTLLSWKRAVTKEALRMYEAAAMALLRLHRGYMVEAVDGLIIAAFFRPCDAVVWGIQCHEVLLHLPWSSALLQHTLAEEIVMDRNVGNNDPLQQQQQQQQEDDAAFFFPETVGQKEGRQPLLSSRVLLGDPKDGEDDVSEADMGHLRQSKSADLMFRGLRLKTGICSGRALSVLSAVTGRMSYRGKVMNRAARIAHTAATGQVLCSPEVWLEATASNSEQLAVHNVTALSLGMHWLKGVRSSIELFLCCVLDPSDPKYRSNAPNATALDTILASSAHLAGMLARRSDLHSQANHSQANSSLPHRHSRPGHPNDPAKHSVGSSSAAGGTYHTAATGFGGGSKPKRRTSRRASILGLNSSVASSRVAGGSGDYHHHPHGSGVCGSGDNSDGVRSASNAIYGAGGAVHRNASSEVYGAGSGATRNASNAVYGANNGGVGAGTGSGRSTWNSSSAAAVPGRSVLKGSSGIGFAGVGGGLAAVSPVVGDSGSHVQQQQQPEVAVNAAGGGEQPARSWSMGRIGVWDLGFPSSQQQQLQQQILNSNSPEDAEAIMTLGSILRVPNQRAESPGSSRFAGAASQRLLISRSSGQIPDSRKRLDSGLDPASARGPQAVSIIRPSLLLPLHRNSSSARVDRFTSTGDGSVVIREANGEGRRCSRMLGVGGRVARLSGLVGISKRGMASGNARIARAVGGSSSSEEEYNGVDDDKLELLLQEQIALEEAELIRAQARTRRTHMTDRGRHSSTDSDSDHPPASQHGDRHRESGNWAGLRQGSSSNASSRGLSGAPGPQSQSGQEDETGPLATDYGQDGDLRPLSRLGSLSPQREHILPVSASPEHLRGSSAKALQHRPPKVASWKTSLAATGAIKAGSRTSDAPKGRPAPVYEEEDEEEQEEENRAAQEQLDRQQQQKQARGASRSRTNTNTCTSVRATKAPTRAAARDLLSDFAEEGEDVDSEHDSVAPASPPDRRQQGRSKQQPSRTQADPNGQKAPHVSKASLSTAEDSDAEDHDDLDDGGDSEKEEAAHQKPPPAYLLLSRRQNQDGPTSWAEVDEPELAMVAEKLVQSVNKSTQSEDVMAKIFQSVVQQEAQLLDPLGFGPIDPLSMTIVGSASGGGAAPGDSPTDKASTGHVGRRTFRTLARTPTTGSSSSVPGVSDPGNTSTVSTAMSKLLPNQEGFDPEAYLATFHPHTRMRQLRAGMHSLSTELSERQGQLKQLIKGNFDRFISCKDAIDDIYARLGRMEAEPEAGASTTRVFHAVENGGKPARTGSAHVRGAHLWHTVSAVQPVVHAPRGSSDHPAKLAQTTNTVCPRQASLLARFTTTPLRERRVLAMLSHRRLRAPVQSTAGDTFGPILDRATKADRIRSVSNLMRRFHTLFSLPSRIQVRASGRAGVRAPRGLAAMGPISLCGCHRNPSWRLWGTRC